MHAIRQTPRQAIKDVLVRRAFTSRELAELLGISERQVEDHLPHIIKSLARDSKKRFLLEPATCRHCNFIFRNRKRLTKPSRCPHCRSEDISQPRYRIQRVSSSHDAPLAS